MQRAPIIAVVACCSACISLPQLDAPPVDGIAVGDAVTDGGSPSCESCVPPPPRCEDDARVYQQTVGCAGGQCEYETRRESCEHGCLDGRCLQCVAHDDDFETLDPSMWSSWTNDDIDVSVKDGALRAFRASKLTEDWGVGAGVALRPRVDFSAGAGVTVSWIVELHDEAVWMRTHAQVQDKAAARSLSFDYGIDEEGAEPDFIFRLSFESPFEHYWHVGTKLGAAGRTLRFVLSNPSSRTVTFAAYDGAKLLLSENRTFSDTEWNGFGWAVARWYANGWPYQGEVSSNGAPNTVHVSLHAFSASCSIDGAPPTVGLGGPSPETAYKEDLEITVAGKDAESGIRCVRVAWDDWPAGDGACAETTRKTRHPATGERTLHIRAWDWGGNRTETKAIYRREP